MHRVELKGRGCSGVLLTRSIAFLMHRVELKGILRLNAFVINNLVPNAPCGVESAEDAALFEPHPQLVPNAPCGVESPCPPLHGSL